jgi:hypothetical protein
MKTQTLYPIALALALVPITFTTAVLSQPSSSSWLERKPLTNWNRPTASIPKAPNRDFPSTDRCKQQIRNPSTPEERAVNAAGWTITKGRGETQSSGDLVLVKGQTSFDGMCRPVQYQQFVFVKGVFAGTISPNLMNSRSDGNLIQTSIQTPSRMRAEFSRYTAKDALCCASKTSEVIYRIDQANKRPLVVPLQVRTYPARSN